MRTPLLMVTAAHRRVREHEAQRRPVAARTSSGTIGAKSWPSAPRPCSHSTLQAGARTGLVLDGFEQSTARRGMSSFMPALWPLPARPRQHRRLTGCDGPVADFADARPAAPPTSRHRSCPATGGRTGPDNAAMSLQAPPLQAFHPAVAAWFERTFPAPTAGAGAGLAGDPLRAQHAGRRADRFGQDPHRVPGRHRRAGARRPGRRACPTRPTSSTSRR